MALFKLSDNLTLEKIKLINYLKNFNRNKLLIFRVEG